MVVQGAGPVGLSAVLVAAISGAREIITIDASPNRLEIAKQLGATATVTLDQTPDERRAEIYDRIGPSGPDLVIEAAGFLPAFPEGLNLTGAHGRYLILGLWGALGTQAIAPRELTTKNMTIAGASFPKPKHYYTAMHLAARLEDRIHLSSLITHRFGISQASEALAAVRSGAVIKAVIDPALTDL